VDNLWSPGFFYPFESVIGFSDNHFATFWACAAARAVGAVREDAFFVLVLGGQYVQFFLVPVGIKTFRF
jgi:hypothetical protein